MRKTTPSQDFVRGIWKENPVLIQMLGLCPALAVTNTVKNALAMSAATFFVLTCSSVLIASVKGLIPKEVRISSYILVIATFVTLADMILQAYAPVQHKDLGAFIALIVVNCMILGRQEAFSSKNTVFRSLLDAIGVGIGFTIALIMMGGFREILGVGTVYVSCLNRHRVRPQCSRCPLNQTGVGVNSHAGRRGSEGVGGRRVTVCVHIISVGNINQGSGYRG